MMQAPKDPTRFIKMICIESMEFVDKVWGDCSLIKGQSYDVLIDNKMYEEFYLVKFGTGLCPHQSKYLKTEAQIRDEKLESILNKKEN